MRVRTSKNTGI